jgi:isoleucyl-tRNA synthetase
MTEKTAPDAVDYRDTVFLPKTDFPMKAGLPQKEPGILARWQAMDIYGETRKRRAGREQFILHDGPPYANGDMHIGHALNHILKDMVCRTQTLLGKDSPYIPGWDCHGLPIEWRVEEEYRKKKRNKDEVPVKEFRAECRAYAQNWVNVQREQIKRLGVLGNWDKPYLTMDFDAEATIVAELMKFAESGQLYRGAKPVMWSPVEKTALAEAEVEYEDITSTQIDVAFEIVESPIPELVGAHAVIWTTTPWTIPVNQAIAYSSSEFYMAVDTGDQIYLVARSLLNDFLQRTGREISSAAHDLAQQLLLGGPNGLAFTFDKFKSQTGQVEGVAWYGFGSGLAGIKAQHPMARFFAPSPLGGEGSGGINAASPLAEFYLRLRPFLDGSAFVTTDSGTGLVHMAPDHGEDDFDLCKAHGIEPVFAVQGDGKYRDDWAWLGGQGSVINPKFNSIDGPILQDLQKAGGLVAHGDFKHSYPHSWRSKAKVIYRCTPQWFVPMDKSLSHREREGAPQARKGEGATLREKAMAAIAATRFVPEKGRNRIGSMVEGRPDWVLSRQRAWGVPITLFVDRKTGQYLCDAHVNERIVAAVKAEGVDAWCDENAQAFLGDAYAAADYERVTDILDVWFDSGCTHAFVLESGKWPELLRTDGSTHPADMYLEGSDQHRGWFQSSLLQSCGTRGQAPYKAVLTHGFTMDQKGMKMSKSLGNTINPADLMRDYGADILRLWALSVDFTEDHRIGKEILSGVADQYRKLRNTFRYLLGALDGFSEAEKVPVAEMPELERYVLHLLADMDAKLAQAVEDFDYNSYVRLLSDFANNDLSAFFFDIRKDSLYCDAATSPKRRAYRTVLDILFHALVRYAAPVLVFTAEEVWQTRFPDEAESVHFLEWPEVPFAAAPNTRHPREGGDPRTHTSLEGAESMDSRLRGNDDGLVEKWAKIRSLRTEITEAIEPLRRNKTIGSSLEAEVTLPVASEPFPDGLEEVAIVSAVHRGAFDMEVTKTTHHKCGRCWRHLPEVSADGALCGRCEEVVHG